jgi:FK506-binding protein 4/5
VYEVRLLDWSNEVDISDQQDGGIIKRIISSGEGWDKPTEDITVKVSIIGSTDDDEEFENREISFITEEEAIKQVGVLPSLMKGILTMRNNEVSVFAIKAKYAYGKEGNDERHIMPNENLSFKVHLLSYEHEDLDYKNLSSHDKLVLATAKKDYGNNLYGNYLIERAMRKYSLSLRILNKIYITGNAILDANEY